MKAIDANMFLLEQANKYGRTIIIVTGDTSLLSAAIQNKAIFLNIEEEQRINLN